MVSSTLKNNFTIYSRYNHPPKVITPVGNIEDSVVDYSAKDQVDINNIVNYYVGNGLPLPVVNRPIYGDFSNSFTFDDVFVLRDNFEQLYSELLPEDKKRFSSIDKFYDFVTQSSDEEIISFYDRGREIPISSTGTSVPVEPPKGDIPVTADTSAAT